MKALVLKKDTPSSPPSLISTNLPIPTLKPGYAVVKIHAARINPSDLLNASGGFSSTTFPRVPGRDYAGVVQSGPPSLIGKRVFGTSGSALSFTEDGAHAEYLLVPIQGLSPMPVNLTFAQAATIGVPWTTAFIVLDRARTTSAETVLVLGATGAVGSAVVELARTKGCNVITASRRSVTNINTLEDPQLSKVLSLTNNRGADVVIDTVGDPVLMRAALDVLARRGRIAYIAAPRSGSTDFTFDMKTLYRKEQCIVGCNSLNYSIEEMAIILQSLTPEFESANLSVTPEEELIKVSLGEEAIAGYAMVKERSGKKIVISIG
jgi:NADPH:quinone reductase